MNWIGSGFINCIIYSLFNNYTPAPSGDALLLMTGDNLLLMTGDDLLLMA